MNINISRKVTNTNQHVINTINNYSGKTAGTEGSKVLEVPESTLWASGMYECTPSKGGGLRGRNQRVLEEGPLLLEAFFGVFLCL